jgi:hypothetical protein
MPEENHKGAAMKVFRVVAERDGITTKEPGITATEIRREEFRYAALTIEQVWEAIAFWRNDPECTVIAIIEEHPAIDVIEEKP